MSELNNLIPISYDNPERPTVSGRELHDFLEIKTAYKDWFPRMCEYGFTEGEDFNLLRIERVQDEGGRMVSRTVDDHQLTIPMAKELCMIQRNERGKQARQYFLAVEAQWNSPEAVMRRTATSIAKDYGMSGEKLNSILHGLKIQWKNSDGQWVLYAKYSGKGYTKNRKGRPFEHNSGKITTPNTTVWTEAGQRFIYEQLKAIGLTPSIDHNENVEQTTFERGT